MSWLYRAWGPSGLQQGKFIPTIPPEEEGVSKSIPHGIEMVLLVEDEDQVRTTRKRILENWAITFCSLKWGRSSLDLAESRA